MKTTSVKMTDTTARKLYASNIELRPMLEESFPEGFFSCSIDERCQDCTLDECYDSTGRPKAMHISEIPEDLHQLFLSIYDGIVMSEFANEGKKLSYSDETQKKWYPWFNLLSSGALAFGHAHWSESGVAAGDASRLRIINEKRAIALGKNKNYQDVMKRIMGL